VQTSDPWRANLWPKFEILTFWGLYSHTSAPINVKFGTGELGKRTLGPLLRAKFHVYRGNVWLLRGQKLIFGLLSTNYKQYRHGCASRRPAGKTTSHFFIYSRRATHDLHHTWHGDREGPFHFCTPSFFDPINISSLGLSPPPESDQTNNLTATYRRAQMLRIS